MGHFYLQRIRINILSANLFLQLSVTMKLLAILCLVQFTIIKSQPIEKSDVEQCEYIEVTAYPAIDASKNNTDEGKPKALFDGADFFTIRKDDSGDLTIFAGVYVRIEERVLSNIPKNPVWKLPTKDRFIFNIGNGKGWTIGRLRGLTSGNYYYKSGSELLPIVSQTWENTEGKRGEIQVKCFNNRELLEIIPSLETATIE